MAKKKLLKQQTLEATMGKSRVRGAAINPPKKKAVTDTSNGHASQSSPSSTMVVRSSPRNHNALPSSAPTAFSGMQNRSSPLVPKKSNQRVVVLDSSSSESEAEPQPVKKTTKVVSDESDEDDGDDDIIRPSSSAANRTRRLNDESSDSEDGPLATPVSASRPKRNVVLDDSDEEEDEEPQQLSSPTKRRRLIRRGGDLGSIREEDEQPAPRSSQAARRKPRTEKEKARELLRRKRAGEIINEEDLEEEEEDDEEVAPKKALYDSDSDNMALKEFEDDDEGVLDPTHAAKTEGSPDKNKRPKKKKKQISSDSDSDNSDANSSASGRGSGDEDEEGSEDDWVVDDGAIGVPDDLMTEIPLEFTKHSHKPLKEHFRDVIEWCVQNKVNPGFAEKQHPIYRLGWQKLDDEVRGLAQSKFASSAWKTDFFMALRARPYYKDEEVGGMQNTFGLENCGACGRSGHPAKFRMQFLGAPYYKSFNSPMFLEPVDSKGESSSSSSSPSSASSSDDEGESNEDAKEGIDEDGNIIEPFSKAWLVGTVCHSNAETAHSLLHWKFALHTWVDANLDTQGYMTPDKLKERLKWKPRKKYKLVDKILKKWVEQQVISRLWREFKETIETARNKSTTGRGQR
ncbi:hypothetical protein QBC37DRAFT_306492 [Rhypophila decipiens]|uniref:DUF4211 domain-containing protein n=1 Tax=Rhypophila decipiens TaxID=261697 RepID=A0AAN7BBU0_9PEZI|nr:hypothetical protein QBC37DRAFT_306492 [Rhypophila decipiens]